jgi:hypothetical protein
MSDGASFAAYMTPILREASSRSAWLRQWPI